MSSFLPSPPSYPGPDAAWVSACPSSSGSIRRAIAAGRLAGVGLGHEELAVLAAAELLAVRVLVRTPARRGLDDEPAAA